MSSLARVVMIESCPELGSRAELDHIDGARGPSVEDLAQPARDLVDILEAVGDELLWHQALIEVLVQRVGGAKEIP